MDNITRIISLLHRYCTSNGIGYVIVGGFSVLVFGRTRMTLDIDIIVEHMKIDRPDFIEYFRSHNFDISSSDLEFVDDQLHGSIFERNTMFRIDLKGVHGSLEQKSIDLALKANFNGVEAYFDNPNLLIPHKLKYGSEQDVEDAIAVLYRSKDLLDLDLMREIAQELKISRILNEFLTSNIFDDRTRI